jgi:hypothetical protein
MKTKKLWKSMQAGMKSTYGNVDWKIGEWQKINGKLVICENGFHASPRIIDAMRYVSLGVLAQVEVRGKHRTNGNKQAWEEMRIVKAWKWSKEESVRLAIFTAEKVIGIFEKQYPDDKRPRQAIDAAKRWLENPTEENRDAAWDAAGDAAWAARDAAWDAAGDAAWAAWAAWDAARAAWEARDAARAAARANAEKLLDNCEKYIQSRIKYLKPFK